MSSPRSALATTLNSRAADDGRLAFLAEEIDLVVGNQRRGPEGVAEAFLPQLPCRSRRPRRSPCRHCSPGTPGRWRSRGWRRPAWRRCISSGHGWRSRRRRRRPARRRAGPSCPAWHKTVSPTRVGPEMTRLPLKAWHCQSRLPVGRDRRRPARCRRRRSFRCRIPWCDKGSASCRNRPAPPWRRCRA